MSLKVGVYVCLFKFLVNDVIATNGECKDLNGRTISQDMHYVPGPDSCTLCICDNGHPKWCKAVLCSPPQDCKSFRVGMSCCEFICLDDALTKGDSIVDFGADFGLRLVVSAIAAILSLCLLFFLVHRLRKRKIRGRQNRQLSEDERSLASIGYITGSLGYFGGHGGPDRHLELHYEEPPTHLSLWKPSRNYFPTGEAPPPYEEAVQQPRTELTITTSNTLPNISHRTIPLNVTTTGTIRFLSSRREACTEPRGAQDMRHHAALDANRNSVSLPRNTAADMLLLPKHAASEVSTLRYEININASPEGLYNSLRVPVGGVTKTKKMDHVDVNAGDTAELTSWTVEDIPPPQLLDTPDSCDDSSAIPSDMLYEDMALLTTSPSHLTSDSKDDDSEEGGGVVDVEEGTELTPLPLQDDPPSSCDCSSLQCLTNNDDNDDYRSECENCKSGHGSSYYLDCEEPPEPPETMTLQRQVTKEADEFDSARTSLTLPTHCRRPTRGIAGARENWFSSMPESGTSSEEDE